MSRRKSIFEVNQVSRVQQKQHEEILSDEIDQNLRTLALFKPMSDSAKPLLIKDAFLKANKVAFQYVVHYLATTINLPDFRKRFHWPVTTSTDESDFRTAALAYFNDLQTQHKWNIGPFKMLVVLFPGGVEFMKILVEISKLALRTILKDNDSLHLINSGGITMCTAQAHLTAAEEAFEEMDRFCRKVHQMSMKMQEKTMRLKELLKQLLRSASIKGDALDQEFLSMWQSHQLQIIKRDISPNLDVLEQFATKSEFFEKRLSDVKQQPVVFDKNKMKSLGLLNGTQHLNPQIDYDKLFEWFGKTVPEMKDTLNIEPPWNVVQLRQEIVLLNQLTQRADLLLFSIDGINLEFSLGLHSISQLSNESISGHVINYWQDMLILTPTIKMPSKNNHRIAIWETIPGAEFSPRPFMPDYSRAVTKLREESLVYGDAHWYNDSGLERTVVNKLDPLAVLNTAMQRNKGTSKGSPRRISTSPARSSKFAGLSSTLITEECPPKALHFSP